MRDVGIRVRDELHNLRTWDDERGTGVESKANGRVIMARDTEIRFVRDG